MLCRVPFRNFIPPTLRIFRVTEVAASKQWTKRYISNHALITDMKPAVFTSHRLYSLNSEPPTVDYEYVKKATSNDNVLIVDVRESEEIKEHGKIPNSLNIPLNDVPSALSTLPEKEFSRIYSRSKPSEDTEIIFYCMIGKRSGKAQQEAINLGFKNTKNYLGSWTDWATKL